LTIPATWKTWVPAKAPGEGGNDVLAALAIGPVIATLPYKTPTYQFTNMSR